MTFYNAEREACIVINKNATPEFWDSEWERHKKNVIYPKKVPQHDTYLKITKKHLPADSTILEGGCGLGYYSYIWSLAGYKTTALDYAENTINYLNETIPEINPVLGDLFAIPFDENYFDGYWSLGVIEHFWKGYEGLKSEMHRVLKNDGILFLSFPHMSKIRRLKAFFGAYTIYDKKIEPENFYQFLLNEDNIIGDFERSGFELITRYRHGSLKGIADELPLFAPFIKYLRSHNRLIHKIIRASIDRYCTYFFSHTIILVFKVIK